MFPYYWLSAHVSKYEYVGLHHACSSDSFRISVMHLSIMVLADVLKRYHCLPADNSPPQSYSVENIASISEMLSVITCHIYLRLLTSSQTLSDHKPCHYLFWRLSLSNGSWVLKPCSLRKPKLKHNVPFIIMLKWITWMLVYLRSQYFYILSKLHCTDFVDPSLNILLYQRIQHRLLANNKNKSSDFVYKCRLLTWYSACRMWNIKLTFMINFTPKTTTRCSTPAQHHTIVRFFTVCVPRTPVLTPWCEEVVSRFLAFGFFGD